MCRQHLELREFCVLGHLAKQPRGADTISGFERYCFSRKNKFPGGGEVMVMFELVLLATAMG